MRSLVLVLTLLCTLFSLGACGTKTSPPIIQYGAPAVVPPSDGEAVPPLVPCASLSASAQRVEPTGTIYEGSIIGVMITAKCNSNFSATFRLKGSSETFQSGTILRKRVTATGTQTDSLIIEALDNSGNVVGTSAAVTVTYTVVANGSIDPADPIAPLYPEDFFYWEYEAPPIPVCPVYIGYTAHQSRVIQLYGYLLGRFPEPQGLQHWTLQLDSGVPDHEVIIGIAGSTEFFQLSGNNNTGFVNNLYIKLLYRIGEPAGVTGWVGQLNSGAMSRSEVVRAFIFSAEYKGI